MKSIAFIYRKPNPRLYSIEKVFEPIELITGNSFRICQVFAPYYTGGLLAVIRNLFYFFRIRNKYDVFHITGDIHYAALMLPSTKVILTIHDLVFMERSKGVKRTFFKWLYIILPIKKSRFVTAISEKSKTEILKYYKHAERKIVVIPNSISKDIQFRLKEFEKSLPRVLFIGTTENKNLDRVIEAVSSLNVQLVIIGILSEETKKLLLMKNVNYVNLFALSDVDIANQYAQADIVLFPSLYEGFGMPIIEGQKTGRVVITSDLSPMKEIAGSAACLVDPYDVNSIRAAIVKVIEDDNFRTALINMGVRNAELYSPEIVVQQFNKLYSQIQ